MTSSNERMIREQIAARGVRDRRVLDALRAVPRSAFVPAALQAEAFEDSPLPLDHGQTISQPFMVATMTELLRLDGSERVLEIGTGSGYQTAILSRLARTVYSAEIEPELAREAGERLAGLGIGNVILRVGNGVEIFRDEAPFDCILVAAAPIEIPEALLAQLAEGGRCVIPAGDLEQQFLWLVERTEGRLVRERLGAVRFVPMRGLGGFY